MSDDVSTPPVTPRRTRVAVVFGGRSTEHAVSCISAGSVLRAVDRERYDVVPVGISRDGRWVLAADDPERLAISAGELPEVPGDGAAVVLSGDPTHRGLAVHTAHRLDLVHRAGEVGPRDQDGPGGAGTTCGGRSRAPGADPLGRRRRDGDRSPVQRRPRHRPEDGGGDDDELGVDGKQKRLDEQLTEHGQRDLRARRCSYAQPR